MRSNNYHQSLKYKEYKFINRSMDPNAASSVPEIVEEKIQRSNGELQLRKYIKGKFLGKGGFAKCYEFTN